MSKAKKIHLRTTMADGRNGSSSVCGHGRPGRWVKLLPLAEFLKAPIEHRCKDCQWSAERKTREQPPAKLVTSEEIARHIFCQVNPKFAVTQS
jgi:hypothetical protein